MYHALAFLLMFLVVHAAREKSTLKPVSSNSEATLIEVTSEAKLPANVSSAITDCTSANNALSSGVVVIQGLFDSAGEKLLQLKPVRCYSWHSKQPTPYEQKGRFIVEITYASGEVTTVSFDALVADDSSPGITKHGFFEVTVPVSGKIASILITDRIRRTIFARIDGSEICHDLST
jgi:hypothetical protein